MRRRIQKYRGERARFRRKPGDKSTKICIHDIFLLVGSLHMTRLWNFVLGRSNYGRVVSIRLSRILILLDEGRITKSQYGVYHFHDEPVAPVVREMSISLGSAGVSLNKMKQAQSVPAMPDFSKVFEGR